jgi:SAM-dependent methyltransferase
MLLPLGLTEVALAAAEAETDPDSLAAAQRMRARFGPDLGAAALTQAALRRRARVKFGDDAAAMFFTRDGLEQATRPRVAEHHAARLLAAGVIGVVDLGCGVGSDAVAFRRAGLAVRASEIDPVTADVAAANLTAVSTAAHPEFEVVVGDAETQPLEPTRTEAGEIGWFADPARRDQGGRVWTLHDLSPSWSLVLRLLDGRRVAGVKLGPALPHAEIPGGIEAEWVTESGSTVEAALWSGGAAIPDARRATVLQGPTGSASLLADPAAPSPDVGPIGRYVYEPDGAVIRAGAIPVVAAVLDAWLIDPKIAYLTSDRRVTTPFARTYEVLDRLPYDQKMLRRWLRERQIGRLEIKQRGIELDPAQLRRRLAPRGGESGTLLITRTPRGATALSVRRVSGP